MRGLLNFSEAASSTQYETMINFNTARGLKPIVFAQRQMSLEEAEKYHAEYLAARRNTLDQAGKMSTLTNLMENNLSLVAVIGFKNALKIDSKVTIDHLRSLGVNIHMLSGDTMEHCKMTSHALELQNKNDNFIDIHFSDVESGRSQLKRALDAINNNLSNKTTAGVALNPNDVKHLRRANTLTQDNLVDMKNLYIVMSGKSLEVAFSNTYLFEHLKFIFEFARTIIGYEFSPSDKARLVKIFNELERKTMAVGDGFNDVNMIQTANVGFQVMTPNVGYQFGDILINNLYSIPVCMSLHCRSWNNNLQIAVHNIYKYSMTLMTISILYQIYCLVSGATILTSFFFLNSMFFIVPLSLCFVFLNDLYSVDLRKKVSGLYCEKNYISKLVNFRVLFFHLFPESLVEGIIILIVPLHCMQENILADGIYNSAYELTIAISVLALLCFTFKNIICCEHNKIFMTLISIFAWAFMVLVIYILYEIKLFNQAYQTATAIFVTNWNTMMLILILALLLLAFNYSYWVSFSHRKYYPIYHIISRSIETGNNEILDTFSSNKKELFMLLYKLTDPFTATYKKCFENKSEVSIVVTNLLLPGGSIMENVISRWKLQFSSKILHKKFTIYTVKRFLPIMRLLLAVGAICIFIYLLLTGLIDRSSNGQTAWVNSFIFILVPLFYYLSSDTKWAMKVNTYSIVFQLTLVVCSVIYCLTTSTDYTLLGTVVLIFLSVNYNIEFGTFFCLSIIAIVGFGLTFLANVDSIRYKSWDGVSLSFPLISISFEYLAITLTIILQRRRNELLIKEEFITGANLDSTSVLAKDLLSLLLPKFVLDRMHNFFEISGEKLVFDDEDKVSIMFCDIADFDDVVRKNENNIVRLLDKIFRKFDDLCVLYGIQKIETVGKTYMAASGLNSVEKGLAPEISKINPTLRVLNLCKDMMTHIKEYEGLKLKIGIHVGKPVMGVIGYHKPQFSLIGDVVNTTSRHCTTGKKGHIMLSEAAWAEVVGKLPMSKGYNLEIIKTEMKGKKEAVNVYHLFEKKKLFIQAMRNIVANRANMQDQLKINQVEIISKALNSASTTKKTISYKILDLIEQLRPGKMLKSLYSNLTLRNSMKNTGTASSAQFRQTPQRNSESRRGKLVFE